MAEEIFRDVFISASSINMMAGKAPEEGGGFFKMGHAHCTGALYRSQENKGNGYSL